MKEKEVERILLAHGAGGRLTLDLVRELFLPAFRNPGIEALSDSAVLPSFPEGRPAITTDAFVVDPPVFPGGDLGSLSVHGSVNDLAVAGARPLWLTWALVLEEGLERDLLDTFVKSAARAAQASDVAIVAGDTKVVPRGKGDRAFVATAGVGVVPPGRDVADRRIETGDAILVSGPIGDHGATIMAARHGIAGRGLLSDCASVSPLVEALFAAGVDVHAMHDPTRGGVATTCNEAAMKCGLRFELHETAIPVRTEVHGVCELLGLEPLYLACEGRVLAWVRATDAEKALEALRRTPNGEDAVKIGHVLDEAASSLPVVLKTAYGGHRPLDLLSGGELPRIC